MNVSSVEEFNNLVSVLPPVGWTNPNYYALWLILGESAVLVNFRATVWMGQADLKIISVPAFASEGGIEAVM